MPAHRARVGLNLPGQWTRGARPRCAIAVRRRIHRRAIDGDGAAGPDRRDHCRQTPGRRRILEEAAGIAGLHSRRHEAELRLKAAEDNLTRLDDILQQIDTQAESLKKQARQAARYRGLAAEIRRNEALLAIIHQAEAATAPQSAKSKLEASLRDVAEKTQAQAETARLQAIAAHELPQLRGIEAEVGSELQRLVLAERLSMEKKGGQKAALPSYERRIAQTASDITRETALIEDALSVLTRLETEANELTSTGAAEAEIEAARRPLAEAEAALAITEKAFAEAQDTRSGIEARRASLTAALRKRRRGSHGSRPKLKRSSGAQRASFGSA